MCFSIDNDVCFSSGHHLHVFVVLNRTRPQRGCPLHPSTRYVQPTQPPIPHASAISRRYPRVLWSCPAQAESILLILLILIMNPIAFRLVSEVCSF